MMDNSRRSIQDLIARHELEPELSDIYVEGGFDKEILEKIFSGQNSSSRVVYEIDTINVPVELVVSHKLTDGNKQRVITLARELAVIQEECAYRCLVDRDLDHWFGPLEVTKHLAWTAVTSIETYYLNEEFLREIFFVLAKCKIDDWELFHCSMIDCLRSLYCLRLADKELNLNGTRVAYDKSLKKKDDEIVFDAEGYILKFLQKNSATKQLKEFTACVETWQLRAIGEPNQWVHGHDFVFLIAWAIGEFGGGPAYKTPIAIERILVLLAERAAEILEVL